MKKNVMTVLALVLLIAIPTLAACTGTTPTTTTPTTSGPFEVRISGFAFEPETIAVPVGTTLIWTNLDREARVVHGNDEPFQSSILTYGDTFSYTFTQAGTFGYHLDWDDSVCGPEPPEGTVIVE